jgi:hypothetical protein
MVINDRVEQGADDTSLATLKTEFLFQSLSSAVLSAIATISEGYICEALSAAKAVSADVGQISSESVILISTIYP